MQSKEIPYSEMIMAAKAAALDTSKSLVLSKQVLEPRPSPNRAAIVLLLATFGGLAAVSYGFYKVIGRGRADLASVKSDVNRFFDNKLPRLQLSNLNSCLNWTQSIEDVQTCVYCIVYSEREGGLCCERRR
jgi:hypothetical protein